MRFCDACLSLLCRIFKFIKKRVFRHDKIVLERLYIFRYYMNEVLSKESCHDMESLHIPMSVRYFETFQNN